MVSRPTMRSFQATVLPRSRAGLAAEMPNGFLPEAMALSLANSSAAWISAFDGMQPTLRQVPPGSGRLDDHRVDAELAGADGADVAAGAGADDQELAGDLLHRQPSRKIIAGVSSSALTRWTKTAASQPSMTR